MQRHLLPLLLALTAGPACQKRAAAPAGPPGTAARPRVVEVRVSNMGYEPERVAGRAGETLKLAFRYDKSAGECGREVLLPEGAAPRKLALAEGAPAEATLTLPAKGELRFTCGMNMLRGSLVVE